jgi:hypothetical protein
MICTWLQFEVGTVQPLDDRHRLGRGIEEISRDVAGVDRLDDQCEALAGEAVGGVPQIAEIDPLGLGAVVTRRQHPGHGMQEPALGRPCIDECGFDPVAKFLLAPG